VRKHRKIALSAVTTLACVGLAGYLAWVSPAVDIPFVSLDPPPWHWSIGIYTGDDPFNVGSPEGVDNPVLTARDVTDVEALFVADPFMVGENGRYYMFFEVMNRHTNQGDIAVAESDDGFSWAYGRIIIDEPFHLSYPCVFLWEGTYYMIPETHEKGTLRLYKAEGFPYDWSFVGTLLEGDFADPTFFSHAGGCWLFAGSDPDKYDTLRLYYADQPAGPWTEHPDSPVVAGNPNIARPGGRVLAFRDRLVRFTQDDYPTYGNQVNAFEILTLTRDSYREQAVDDNPILEPTASGWNRDGMHHIDVRPAGGGRWIACVDGVRRGAARLRFHLRSASRARRTQSGE